MGTEDSREYREKKQFFERMLTIYGRKPVLEALQDPAIKVFRLHLADTNKPASMLDEMVTLARKKGAEVVYHSRSTLSRISKNSKQDQGVALDILCEKFLTLEEFLQTAPTQFELIAIDGITNPQNLGMIVRSISASPMHGILLAERCTAKLDSLVIKASAGTLFKARIIKCPDLHQALQDLKQKGSRVYGLDANGNLTLGKFEPAARSVYVVGNETEGLSPSVEQACDDFIGIPMCNGVESLNVSIAASLIAFRFLYR